MTSQDDKQESDPFLSVLSELKIDNNLRLELILYLRDRSGDEASKLLLPFLVDINSVIRDAALEAFTAIKMRINSEMIPDIKRIDTLRDLGFLSILKQYYRKVILENPNSNTLREQISKCIEIVNVLETESPFRHDVNQYIAGLQQKENNPLYTLLSMGGTAESYKKFLEQFPEFAAAYYKLQNLSELNEQLPEMEAEYRKVIEENPNNAAAYIDLGNRLRTLGRFDEAVAVYKRAQELNPNIIIYYEDTSQSGFYSQPREKFDTQKSEFGNLELSPDYYELLNKLVKENESNESDVVKKGLVLVGLVNKVKSQGLKLAVIDEDGSIIANIEGF